jgi:hypothetical protein
MYGSDQSSGSRGLNVLEWTNDRDNGAATKKVSNNSRQNSPFIA